MPQRKKTAREQFLERLGLLESDITKLSKSLRDEFENLLQEHTRGDELVRLDTLYRAANALLLAYVISVSDLTIEANVDVAEIKATDEYNTVVAALRKSGLSAKSRTQLLGNFRNTILNYPEEIRKRITTRRPFEDNRSMPYRFKTVYESAQKTVRNLLDLGIKERKSSLDIAKSIKEYVRPTASNTGKISPREIHRLRFGLEQDSDVSVRGGSVDYNSMRIARTETQRTYRHVPEDLNKGKAWVRGFKWNLSRAHPKPDLCDELAKSNKDKLGPGVYKETPDSHPNCICTVTTVLVSEEELLALFDQ